MENMKFNFLQKVRWNAAGQLFHMIYGILLITLIVKYFGAESYTYYVYFQTILASALLVEFGVTSRILNLDKDALEDKVNEYFNAYYSTVFLLAVLSIVSLSFHFLPHGQANYNFTVVITLLVLLNYGRSLFRAFLLRTHRDDDFNKVYITFDFLRLFLSLVFIYFGLVSAILEMLILLVAITFFELFFLLKGIDVKVWSFNFKGGLTFIKCVQGNKLYYLYSLLAVAVFQIPYWIIPLLESNEGVALYALAVLPASLLVTAFYPITSSLLPFLRDSSSEKTHSKKRIYIVLLSLFFIVSYSVFLVLNEFAYKLWLGNKFDEKVVALSDGLFLFGLVCIVKSLYTIYLLSQEKIRQIVIAFAMSISVYYSFLYVVIGATLESLGSTLFLLPLMTVIILVILHKRPLSNRGENHAL